MALMFSLIFLICSAVFAAASSEYGFSVEMIHRDSPKSPMYNPSESHYHRLANTLRRSILLNKAVALLDTAEAPMFNDRGEYLVEVSLGTPPFPILALADTGSDIVWTQCQPCPKCFEQTAPMFDPSKSSTYKIIPCSSPSCALAGQERSCSDRSECRYSISYGDGSHSNGDFAVDTLTMGSTSGRPVAFSRTMVGCGHDSGGTFSTNVSGIVGLGRGPASLVPQMGAASGGKFSYCLTPIGDSAESSKLNFGSNAQVAGSGTVSTPIKTSDRFDSFYALNIEAMSVGGKRFEFPAASALGDGSNVIIDSGTTLTILPTEFYSTFATAISNSISLERTEDPNQFLDFCFKTTNFDFVVPSVTVHFEGADVPLRRENVFVMVAENVVCLAFRGGDGQSISIYGNIAQINFIVGYDVTRNSVSFKPANCSAM
ncbi:aspartic proteinase CDR1-like [Cucurbita pepo subsp. pepo]|uniref:aspartic proteinase CDR1-like n=1 Tax=Cucurbita pepo subsp. pepo TaxID=3664 RepID=UPI000C9D94D4|nr:aspartic proteinase CDR1-like [Cucurbita pepo subsp. pepo]